MLRLEDLHLEFLHLRRNAVLGGVAEDQAFFYGAVQGIVEHQVQAADGGAAESRIAVTAFAGGQLCLALRLRFAENVFDDALTGFCVVSCGVATLPAAICAFADIALAVGAFLGHRINSFPGSKHKYHNFARKATVFEMIFLLFPAAQNMRLLQNLL